MRIPRSRRWPLFAQFACLALAAVILSGCIIVPVRSHPHPEHYYYYR